MLVVVALMIVWCWPVGSRVWLRSRALVWANVYTNAHAHTDAIMLFKIQSQLISRACGSRHGLKKLFERASCMASVTSTQIQTPGRKRSMQIVGIMPGCLPIKWRGSSRSGVDNDEGFVYNVISECLTTFDSRCLWLWFVWYRTWTQTVILTPIPHPKQVHPPGSKEIRRYSRSLGPNIRQWLLCFPKWRLIIPKVTTVITILPKVTTVITMTDGGCTKSGLVLTYILCNLSILLWYNFYLPVSYHIWSSTVLYYCILKLLLLISSSLVNGIDLRYSSTILQY